jgi:16S rRNA C967 or C1407 C5-methylase (RsmB/RsmF family)
MQELDLSEKVLSDIIENDTSFSEALRKIFQNDVSLRPLRGTVAGLVGCELRHHLLFAYLTEPLPDYTPAEKRFLSLGLADAYFFKRIPSATLKSALQTRLGDAKLAAAEPLLDKAEKPEEFIPSDLAKSSNKYLSLRYNTPEWVLKIWEHYGYGTTYKILKKNNHQHTTSVRVRTSLVSDEELLNHNQDYAKSSVDGILCYGGKIPLRKLDEFRNDKVFAERPATKAVLDKFKIEEPGEAFLFNGNADSSILKEMVETYGSSIGLNLGVYNLENYVDVSKMIRNANLKNVNFFATDPSSLESAISRPQDLVIAAPDSSNFDLISEYPDYLLHFKKEGMDALFEKEKAMLEGVSKYVAEGGTLIYMIYTISKKEGHQTVEEFTLNHKEFKLVREAQLFPYEELDTALYYAVMKKETPLAKAEPPLSDVSNALAGSTLSVSAKPQ